MSNIILSINEIDSKSELIERLRKSDVETIMIGENEEQSQDFFEITVTDISNTELLKIGVISEGQGLKPQYSINDFGKIIIGLNKEICLISIDEFNKVLIKKLESLFYEFKFLKNINLIVVVCETEIYCLNTNLETIWNVSLDLIVDYEITDEFVKAVTDDKTYFYKVLNGSLI